MFEIEMPAMDGHINYIIGSEVFSKYIIGRGFAPWWTACLCEVHKCYCFVDERYSQSGFWTEHKHTGLGLSPSTSRSIVMLPLLLAV